MEVGKREKLKIGILNYTFLLNVGTIRMLGYIATSPRINMLCAVGTQMVLARITASNFCYPSEQEFLQAVEDNVRNMKSQGAEYIIMFLHWGREYHHSPTMRQKEIARKIALKGVDMIVGSHPHFIQGYEFAYTKDGVMLPNREEGATEHFIAYSLGNFVSSQGGGSKYGEVLRFELARGADGPYLQDVGSYIVKSVAGLEEFQYEGHARSHVTYHLEVVSRDEFLDNTSPKGSDRPMLSDPTAR